MYKILNMGTENMMKTRNIMKGKNTVKLRIMLTVRLRNHHQNEEHGEGAMIN